MSLVRRLTRRTNAFRQAFSTLEPRQLMAGEGDPVLPDDYEPNNSFAAAYNLGTTNSASIDLATLHVQGVTLDQDYYKFVAPSNGIVRIEAFYAGNTGSRGLRAYNASQGEVAAVTMNGSSGSGATSFGVSAGQTYYIRFSGAMTSDYGISMTAVNLNAGFDWSMVPRFGQQRDAFGLPVIPNTRDYAFPNPVTLGGKQVARFPVSLDSLANRAGDGISYAWNIVGANGYNTSAAAGDSVVDLPEGSYTVTLTASFGGTSVSSSQQITVRNFLIAAVGDSYSSGEGNPHSPQQYDWLGFATRGAIWADSPDAQEALFHRMAHRSGHAGVAQAALWLENADPKTSVTFVFLSHTGSTINTGLLGPIASGDHAVTGTTPAQIDRLASITAGRTIDSLVMSIGGNDIGFADILTSLVFAENDFVNGNYQAELDGIFNNAAGKIAQLRNEWYPQLAARLQQLQIRQTLLVEYPDLTKDANGNISNAILNDIIPGREVDRYELEQALARVNAPFIAAMKDAAKTFGWHFVDGVQAGFSRAGYGTWFRSTVDSAITQGPCGNRNVVTIGDLNETDGKMHPIGPGLTVVKDRIVDVWNMTGLATDTTAPRLLSSGGNINTKAFVFTFSEDVGLSLNATTPTLRNRATGETIPASRISMQWFAGSNTAVYTVSGRMPDGMWDFALPAAQVRDAAGNSLAANATSAMAMLAGDANQDFRVNFSDLLILAANYNQPGKNFQQGNFDYSGDGIVNFDDLLLLASNYNRTLPVAAPAGVATLVAPPPSASPSPAFAPASFGDEPINEDVLA